MVLVLDGVVSEAIILYKFTETQKNKVQMVWYQKLPLCNFIKTQKQSTNGMLQKLPP